MYKWDYVSYPCTKALNEEGEAAMLLNPVTIKQRGKPVLGSKDPVDLEKPMESLPET